MQNSNAFLELEGEVSIVTKDDSGNVLSKDPLDGRIVLKALLHCIEEGIFELKENLERTDGE
jgi:hypothetical protein